MKYQFAIFISICILVLAVMHVIVYEGIITAFGLTSSTLIWKIVFTVLPILVITSLILANRYNNRFLKPIYVAANIWLGLSIYLVMATFIFALWPVIWFGQILLTLAGLISIYGIIHARSTKIKECQISLPNLPSNWLNKKIVFISDTHLGHIYNKKFLEKTVSKIRDLNPDLVLIGGDLYDGTKVNESDIIEPLKTLRPPLGIYFVTGNHEEFADSEHFLSAIREAGIRVLNNEMVEIEGLRLIGVTDRHSTNKENFRSILGGLILRSDLNKPTILLKHQPYDLDIAESADISLQLSGHTHKAQMWPFTYITKIMFRGFDYGLHKFKNMHVLTSSGVGSWGPPLRVGTDSEVVVIRFK